MLLALGSEGVTVLELLQPKWEAEEQQLCAVTLQEVLVTAEIVKVVFTLSLDVPRAAEVMLWCVHRPDT